MRIGPPLATGGVIARVFNVTVLSKVPDDGSVLFGTDVGHYVEVRGPELKLSFPVNKG